MVNMVNIKKNGPDGSRCKGLLSPTIFFLAEVLAPNPPSAAASVGAGQEPCGDNAAKGYKLPDKRRKKQFGIWVWLRHINGLEREMQLIRTIWICLRSYIFVSKPAKLYFAISGT